MRLIIAMMAAGCVEPWPKEAQKNVEQMVHMAYPDCSVSSFELVRREGTTTKWQGAAKLTCLDRRRIVAAFCSEGQDYIECHLEPISTSK